MLARILDRSRRSLRRLHRDGRGNVLVLTAAAIPMLIGGAGLGVDVTQWYLWGRELQMGVDAGALAGTYSQAQGKDYSASARSAVSTNLNVVTVTGTPTVTLGNWAGGTNNAVTVTAQTQRTLPFSGMFLSTAPTISRIATAAIIDSGTFCILATNKTAQAAISIGGNALVKLGCGIASNSNNAESIKIFGSAQVEANPLTAVGGITAGDGNLIGDTTKRAYSVEQADPLANLPTPSPTICNTPKTYDKNITPLPCGVYADLKLKGSHTVQGIYTIDGGELKIDAQYNLTSTGNGVMFILKNGATLDIQGGSNISLTAISAANIATYGLSPAYANILIFEDKSTFPANSTRTSKINGNATLALGGTIYLTKQALQMTGNAAPSTTCLLLIADTVTISGNPIIPNSCPGGGGGGYGAKVVRLVS